MKRAGSDQFMVKKSEFKTLGRFSIVDIYSLLKLTCEEEALCFSQTSCSPAWLWLHQPAVDGSGAEAFFRMMLLVLDLVLRSAKLSSVCAFAL